jgi:hypothetical protein
VLSSLCGAPANKFPVPAKNRRERPWPHTTQSIWPITVYVPVLSFATNVNTPFFLNWPCSIV